MVALNNTTIYGILAIVAIVAIAAPASLEQKPAFSGQHWI